MCEAIWCTGNIGTYKLLLEGTRHSQIKPQTLVTLKNTLLDFGIVSTYILRMNRCTVLGR